MTDTPEQQQESLFRPSKRRKVFRKRTVEDDEDAEQGKADRSLLNESNGAPSAAEEDASEHMPVVRRPIAKKHGIGFSSNGTAKQGAGSRDAAPEETALVPLLGQQTEEVTQTDRFMKPTGKASVVEDKHLTAYVDSKLAELRSSTSTPTTPGNGLTASSSANNASSVDGLGPTSLGHDSATQTHPGVQTKEEQRKGYPYGSRSRNQRPRRQPHVRDASDVARDHMVDMIMRESQVPIYDKTSTPASKLGSPGIDQDEAAAEAFKAEFLADLEEHNRRKPPPPPANSKANPKAGQQVTSGPKLGGSRSQREKMKALEEAKNATGKK